MKLVCFNTHTNRLVAVGDTLQSFRGEPHRVEGFEPPKGAHQSGRIVTDRGSFYASVYSCCFLAKNLLESRQLTGLSIPQIQTATRRLLAGECIECGQPAIPRCYTEAGRREYGISGLCEPCFDAMCEEMERMAERNSANDGEWPAW